MHTIHIAFSALKNIEMKYWGSFDIAFFFFLFHSMLHRFSAVAVIVTIEAYSFVLDIIYVQFR